MSVRATERTVAIRHRIEATEALCASGGGRCPELRLGGPLKNPVSWCALFGRHVERVEVEPGLSAPKRLPECIKAEESQG